MTNDDTTIKDAGTIIAGLRSYNRAADGLLIEIIAALEGGDASAAQRLPQTLRDARALVDGGIVAFVVAP